jgi:hypothetical protein
LGCWVSIWPSHKFVKALGNQPVWPFGRGHHSLSATLPYPRWPWSPACVLAGPACRVGQLWPRVVVSSPPCTSTVPACCPCRLSAAPVLKEEASEHGSSLVLPLSVSLFLSHVAARAARHGHQLSARVECSCSSARPLRPAHRPSSLLASRSGRLLSPRAPDGPCRAVPPPSSSCPACVRDWGATGHPWPCHRRPRVRQAPRCLCASSSPSLALLRPSR